MGDEGISRRIDHELPGFQRGSDLRTFFRKKTPVAAMKAANRQIAAHPGGRRIILEQYLVVARRGLEPLHLEQHVGAACAQFAIVRRKLQRPIEARKRLKAAFQHLQRKSARVPGRRIIGLQRKIFLIRGRRFLRAIKQREQIGTPAKKIGVVWRECERLVGGFQGRFMTLEDRQQRAAILPRIGVVGLERRCAIIGVKSFLDAFENLKHNATIVPGLGEVRLEADHGIGIRQRLVITLQCRKDAAAVYQRLEIIRP